MAEVKLKITAEDKASAVIEKMKANGVNASDRLSGAFEQLNIKSTSAYDKLRASATSAYDRIKGSGVATSDELTRAGKAHAAEMARIDEEQFGKRTSLLQKFKANWLAVTAAIGVIWATAMKGMEMAQAGAANQTQGMAFANLAASYGVSADAMVADLRRVSGETVSVQQLVEKAGSAMLLGVEAKVIPKLMEIAKASSKITGQTVTEAFGDISLGMARQSKLILDNLGIMVDVDKANKAYAASLGKTSEQLSDFERKQAFANAVLEAGQEIIDRTGKNVDSNADKMAKLSASVDNLQLSFGRLIATPVGGFSGALAGFFDDAEKIFAGKISFWEYATTPADVLAKRMEGLGTTNLDATVTPEGLALAQKKIEAATAAAKAAEQKSKAEAAVRAAEERLKFLAEVQTHNDKIIDIEKKRIKTSLDLETTHLKTLTDKYTEAVTAMDKLIDARAAVKGQLDARNTADAAKNAGESDPLNAYLDKQLEIGAAEKKIDEAFGMSAEDKAKAYADLIDLAASYNKAVSVNGVEIVSAFQTEYDYLGRKERMAEKINQLFDAETEKRTTAAEKFAEEMIAAQNEVSLLESYMTSLETVLDRLNNKEINLIFKATGITDILAAGGMVGPSSPSGLPTSNITTPFGRSEESNYQGFQDGGDYYTHGGKTYWNDGSEADSGTSYAIPQYASGTPYVPRTGLALIHQGERIIPASENRPGSSTGSNVVNFNGGVSFVLPNVTNQSSAKDLAREALPEMIRLMNGRTR